MKSKVNCDEMAEDRPKQYANRSCKSCRAFYELCSNYLFISVNLLTTPFQAVCGKTFFGSFVLDDQSFVFGGIFDN